MNAPLKQRLLALAFTALCTASSPGFGQDTAAAEVMLFGVFHFANPGQDVVKTAQVNVMTDANQTYLEQLAARLSTFQPTVVMLEYAP